MVRHVSSRTLVEGNKIGLPFWVPTKICAIIFDPLDEKPLIEYGNVLLQVWRTRKAKYTWAVIEVDHHKIMLRSKDGAPAFSMSVIGLLIDKVQSHCSGSSLASPAWKPGRVSNEDAKE